MNRFTHSQKYPLQPTLPNRVNGVIAEWEEPHPAGGTRKRYALQCQECGLVEHPWPATTMTIHFQPHHEDGRRRCKECRVARHDAEYPACRCDGCNVSKTGSFYR